MTTSLRRSGARTHTVLASATLALLLATSLAGCGEKDADTATDPQTSESTPTLPAESSSETPGETPPAPPTPGGEGPATGESLSVTGESGVADATLISATEVGGSASTLAVALDNEQAQTDFVGQFKPDFGKDVLAALEKPQSVEGSTPYGAVVAVGCAAPESVQIEAGEAGFEVTPAMPKKTVQCFAPMTFVVLFAAPTA